MQLHTLSWCVTLHVLNLPIHTLVELPTRGITWVGSCWVSELLWIWWRRDFRARAWNRNPTALGRRQKCLWNVHLRSSWTLSSIYFETWINNREFGLYLLLVIPTLRTRLFACYFQFLLTTDRDNVLKWANNRFLSHFLWLKIRNQDKISCLTQYSCLNRNKTVDPISNTEKRSITTELIW